MTQCLRSLCQRQVGQARQPAAGEGLRRTPANNDLINKRDRTRRGQRPVTKGELGEPEPLNMEDLKDAQEVAEAVASQATLPGTPSSGPTCAGAPRSCVHSDDPSPAGGGEGADQGRGAACSSRAQHRGSSKGWRLSRGGGGTTKALKFGGQQKTRAARPARTALEHGLSCEGLPLPRLARPARTALEHGSS